MVYEHDNNTYTHNLKPRTRIFIPDLKMHVLCVSFQLALHYL